MGSRKSLFLTNDLRKKLKSPIGELIPGKEKKATEEFIKELENSSYNKLIFVGDRLTNSKAFKALKPDVCIYDGRIGRNERVEVKEPTKKVYNPPGTINKEVWSPLKEALEGDEGEKVYVEGEEDLLALPVSKLSEENNIVAYGLSGKGICYFFTEEFEEDRILGKMKEGKYEKVVAGGTFDRLHLGHKYFLRMSKEYGEKLILGLTSKKMCQEKQLSELIWDYDRRKKEVESFLDSINIDYEIKKIHDIYGPAGDKKDIEAILVTEETFPNAKKINQKRRRKNLPELNYYILYYILAEDGKRIASVRIRKGEINRKGELMV